MEEVQPSSALLKASALFFLQKKLLVVWNKATYTWDWLRHLVDDGALLSRNLQKGTLSFVPVFKLTLM